MSLQVQARALGDPTRHRIFEYVRDSDTAVGVAELTHHFDLNHNAIRQHLAKLVRAGLLRESVAAPSGRGRPRLEYRLDPTTDGRWGEQSPYEHLSLMLTEVVATGDTPVEVGRQYALDHTSAGSQDAGDPAERLAAQMSRAGFDAVAVRLGPAGGDPDRTTEQVEVVLRNCPFAAAADADADTICDLHLGLARGAAERIGGIAVDALVRSDPHAAGCRLLCTTSDPDPTAPPA